MEKEMKALNNIKFGSKIVDILEGGELYFVADIRKASGLDDKTLRKVLNQLLKNHYIQKNDRGQWFVLRDEDKEETVECEVIDLGGFRK